MQSKLSPKKIEVGMEVKIIDCSYGYHVAGAIAKVQRIDYGDIQVLSDGKSWWYSERDLEVINKAEVLLDTPKISYHGATTVVRWPDGLINSAKPCQAQPEKKIKADKFDPTIGVLHCIAKKYVPDYKNLIANAQRE